MIDATQQINTVRRTVGTRTLEAGEARVVTISQSYDTDAADLWDACTNIERIPRWFLPVTGDLRVGGQ
ncbi:MAG TPA: polyketide cyclase, partial [Mycobacterium sp.]